MNTKDITVEDLIYVLRNFDKNSKISFRINNCDIIPNEILIDSISCHGSIKTGNSIGDKTIMAGNQSDPFEKGQLTITIPTTRNRIDQLEVISFRDQLPPNFKDIILFCESDKCSGWMQEPVDYKSNFWTVPTAIKDGIYSEKGEDPELPPRIWTHWTLTPNL